MSQTGQQVVQIGSAVTGALSKTIATAAAPHLGMSLAVAVPIVGAALAGTWLAVSAWMNRKGPKQKQWTTQVVNELEPLLQQNVQAYLNESPRSKAAQTYALQVFDHVWSQVVEGCSQPQMGEPGRRCISERERGGSAKWCPTGTGCDWFASYRDPIANDSMPAEQEQFEQAAAAQGGSNDITDTLQQPVAIGGAAVPVWLLLAGAGLAVFAFAGND